MAQRSWRGSWRGTYWGDQLERPETTIAATASTTEPINIKIAPSNWRNVAKETLLKQEKEGFYKRYFDPKFDTLIIRPGENITEQRAFCEFNGAHGKPWGDTNMQLCGMLGTPCQAIFQYLRIHFEKYHSLEDAVAWKEAATISFILGHNTPVWTGALGSMDPILPKGGYKKIDRMIKTGIIKFWPWQQAGLNDIHIDSCEMFHVKVTYNKPFNPSNEMRIKVSLGPYFFNTASDSYGI